MKKEQEDKLKQKFANMISSFPIHRKKFAMLFLFNFVSLEILNFHFFSFTCEITCIKIQK